MRLSTGAQFHLERRGPKPLYRVELLNIRDVESEQELWPRKTVSDGKKWDAVPTGSVVRFSAKLDFDRNNRVQLLQVRDVDAGEANVHPINLSGSSTFQVELSAG